MKKLNQMAALTALALALTLGDNLAAQTQSPTNGVAGQNVRSMDWQNMDPQEIQKMIQKRMMDTFRERLEVTDDAEWKIVEERLSNVTQARMATVADSGGMMGMGGMMGGRGGSGGGAARGLQSLFGKPSAEAEALQQAIDSKAPSAEIKSLLAKFKAARKEKLAQLVKAQEDLRAVLTTRQEAIAALLGLVD